MRVITLWEIHEWDGGDRQYYRGNCLASQEAADAYKASKRHDCVVKRVITVFDDLEDMEENSLAKRKERALAKLSDEDKAVLGLVG